jgi:hypothetical protein
MMMVMVVVENIDQKDFGKMLHDTDEMMNPMERVTVVVVDEREKKTEMDWNLFVDWD